jgi:hypothetical protein
MVRDPVGRDVSIAIPPRHVVSVTEHLLQQQSPHRTKLYQASLFATQVSDTPPVRPALYEKVQVALREGPRLRY